MAYLLDSNVFMEAQDRYYGRDFCPAYWDWLVQEFHKGTLLSIEPVYQEILAGEGELAAWAKSARKLGFFRELEGHDHVNTGNVLAWVEGQGYERAGIDAFASGADPFLIAYAWTREMVLVTHEVMAPGSKKKIKIPDICPAFGVRCERPFQFQRDLGARFELSRAKVVGAAPIAAEGAASFNEVPVPPWLAGS